MAKVRRCPSSDELQRMVLGQLPDVKARRIQLHLERCPKCCSALDQCMASDAFLEALRASRRFAEPTKTMQVPIGCLRGALSTWSQGYDRTHSGQGGRPFSKMEIESQLSPPQSPDEIGRLGDFRVLRVLGVGGFAVVFEAEDTRLKRRVALKLMHPSIAARHGGAERFLHEAQSAAALKHEHVVTIYHVGMQGQTPFIALELLHGETLEDYLIRKGHLSIGEVLRIGREIASGLAAAHARGLLHRDIKPANIFLESPEMSVPDQQVPDRQDASQPQTPAKSSHFVPGPDPVGKVKILDFGCAKSWADEVAISDHGLLIGTPAYMAPEQFSGGAVDSRTDLFSLGCVLYRMAAGQRPFSGDNVFAVVRALALDDPKPLVSVNPQVPQSLSDLVGRLLSKTPSGRPATAQAVMDQLRGIEQGVSSQQFAENKAADRLIFNAARRQQRRNWVIGAGIGIGVLLFAYFLFGAQLIRIATNKGQIVLKVDDPSVAVSLTEGQIVIHDGQGNAEITLAAGDHQFDVTLKEPRGEARFKTSKFTLNRGGRKVIEVEEELAKAIAAHTAVAPKEIESGSSSALAGDQRPQTPTTPDLDRRAALWVLSLGGTVGVRVGPAEQRIDIQPGHDLPATDFELTNINLQNCAVSDAGLEQLCNLRHLIELILNHTPLTDAGLERLKCLSELKVLMFSNTSVTDGGLQSVERLQKLESLSMGGTRITDAGLKHLRALKNLQLLEMNWTHVTDAGLVELEALPQLEVLHIRGTRATDAGIAHIRGLTRLHFLNISRLPITDAGLANIEPLTNLQTLALENTRIGDAGLAHLKGLTRLDTLLLKETGVTDAGLDQLLGLQHLVVLDLKGLKGVSDAAVPKILHLRSLKQIDLRDCHVSAKGLAALKAAMPNLSVEWSEPNYAAAQAVLEANGTIDLILKGTGEKRHVSILAQLPIESIRITKVRLAGSRSTLKGVLAALANPGLDALVSLDLSNTPINDADVEGLKSLRALQELSLADTRITDGGLAHLREMTALQRLVLDGTAIRGSGLIHLQELPVLVELRIGCPGLTGLFLVELARLKKLERLSLAKSNFSDEGVQDLVPLTRLRELDLEGTQVSTAGIAKLKAALPQCRIIVPQPAGP